ncbi:Spy/CpxP family protein refolding chaperone [Calothrix sp. PCC 7507]|uniref:Spy/CpxP family protein refolding chaperone n=1 Tax=Calothrix sp. PCC 7507 TaxID=99598 RepID=UPI00029EEFA7|nr:Spy/CpxP family protein refolding chaperone [Calothrix sp. PCC 7507]AFY33198.1 hypothetical protein Cal7507_2781 [Calothrix sp. PCC 7507]
MFFSRSVLLGILLLSFGSAVALAAPSFLFHPSIAQIPAQKPRAELGQVELIQALNLTPEQHRAIEANFNHNKEQMQRKQQALQQATEELRTLIEGTAITNQIREKHREIQELHFSLENMGFESMLAIREVLTLEQRQKFSELIQKQMRSFPDQSQEPNNGNHLQQQVEILSVSSTQLPQR